MKNITTLLFPRRLLVALVVVVANFTLSAALGAPTQKAYLKAPNTTGTVYDNFGWSVSVSGNTVVVGALNEGNTPSYESGAAYVFVRNGAIWSQQAKLKASNAETYDHFGRSVSVSGDTVVVGADGEAGNGTGGPNNNSKPFSGAVYVFVRSGTTWSQQAYLKALYPDGWDYFGSSVAVSGNTVVVGALGESSDGSGQGNNSALNSGAAYVFVRNGAIWSQQAYLKAQIPEASDLFGSSVAVSGNTLVVGAIGEDSDGSGQGNNSALNSGAAYVFVRNGTIWSQQAYLKAAYPDAGDRFGTSVGVSGSTTVVGASSEDSNGTGPGNNSASDSGAAYVYLRSGTVWSQQAYLKASTPEAGDSFGGSVAVSGGAVVVGAYSEDSNGTGQGNNTALYSGAAYVFVRAGALWNQQAYLKASNTGAGDEFGVSVAVSGSTVVVGAFFEDSNGTAGQSDNSAPDSGAAYVFTGVETEMGPAPDIGPLVPSLVTPSPCPPCLRISFVGLPSETYQIARASDVTGPWSTLANVSASEEGNVEFYDTNAPAARAFYRTVSSDGRICSRNAAGYVNVTLRSAPMGSPGVSNLLSNPLNGTNNNLNTILPLPDAYDGTTIRRWNLETQNYSEAIRWDAGLGWSASEPALLVINPGEGFWICPVGPNPLNVTWVGEVPQGTLTNSLAGAGRISFISSQVPQAARVGALGVTGTLELPSEPGDLIYLHDPEAGFTAPYTSMGGGMWKDPDGVTVNEGPLIPVGEGFKFQQGISLNTAWPRTLNTRADCSACAAPSIIDQPQTQTVEVFSCVTFGIGLVDDPSLTFQWYKDGQPVSGANGPFLAQGPIRFADAGQYWVRVTNACGRVDSVAANLTVVPDTTSPLLVEAVAPCGSNKVTVAFNEHLDAISAADRSNYHLSGGVRIQSVVVATDSLTVCLLTDRDLFGASYTLTVDGVRDLAGNSIAGNSQASFGCTGKPGAHVPRYKLAATSVVDGRVTLEWSGDALLQAADTINGPWITVESATSGFRADMTDPRKFYRLTYP